MFVIRNIPEHKSVADIKYVTATPDSPDLSYYVTELAYSMLKAFTPQRGITNEKKNILVYISGYICRKVSRSACDQCKVILMPIINCIHFCQEAIFEYSGCGAFVPRQNLIQLIGSNEQIFGNIPE